MTFCSTDLEMCWWWPNGNCQIIPGSSSNSLQICSTSSAWSGSSRASLKRFHLPQPANKMASSKSLANSCGRNMNYKNTTMSNVWIQGLQYSNLQSPSFWEDFEVVWRWMIDKVQEPRRSSGWQWSKMVQRPHACFSPWIRVCQCPCMSVSQELQIFENSRVLFILFHTWIILNSS